MRRGLPEVRKRWWLKGEKVRGFTARRVERRLEAGLGRIEYVP